MRYSVYNVLVVEDDEDIRNLLAEQLGDKGFYVRRSNDGSAALVRVKGQKPDVMFVDIMMPIMDGIELISELQENPDTSDIPIVLVTAVSTPTSR
jgi:two-component system alkaline phosphatase synthesis response regulator PhoP